MPTSNRCNSAGHVAGSCVSAARCSTAFMPEKVN